MDYAKFYNDANKALIDALVSLWVPGLHDEQEYIKELLSHDEPLLAPPVFQTIFPWKESNHSFLEHASKLHILKEDFVRALDSIPDKEYSFPLNRKPYAHQTESWNSLLNKKKTIVVTSGTGSGKTECFMIPVLQDLYTRRKEGHSEGIQAIFIYPLNALMKNQQKRIDAWCRALNPRITYAIYNGDTLDSISKGKSYQIEEAYPQLISRDQIRNNPPQILFTNPTMLNYMLVRPEDQPILQSSKGTLRWILLDEAHTYSGSSAAELSLQIRRILDAFDVEAEDINFALTSATMGNPHDPKSKDMLKDFVSQITGKGKENISVIDGERVIPNLNEEIALRELDEINNAFDAKATIEDIKGLRKKLNREPAISIKDIERAFNKTMSREIALKLVNQLGSKTKGLHSNGTDGALLPTRIHLFVRSIRGMYACTNPKCKSHKKSKLSIGALTSYQNTVCPVCKKPLLEVATCPHCGGLVLIGEQSNEQKESFRLVANTINLVDGIFDYISDDEIIADNEKEKPYNSHYTAHILAKETNPCPRNNTSKTIYEIDTERDRLIIKSQISDNSLIECYVQSQPWRLVCPHCGGNLKLEKLNYFRASSTFLGRLLAPIVLENAEPSKDKTDIDLLYEGRKYITFTDSRQNTAKSAMALNQDVERNWIRSAIYHKLSELRLINFNPHGGLSPDEESTYKTLKSMTIRPSMLQTLLDNLEEKRKGQEYPQPNPVTWDNLERSLEKSENLRRMYKHLGEARIGGGAQGQDNNPLNYLRALFIDQFGWIPKRSNSLETMGLVKLVYPPLKNARVPQQLEKRGFFDDDWQSFLKICLDYYIRGNRHYVISDSFKQFLTQTNFTAPIYASFSKVHLGNKEVHKWITVTLSKNRKVLERQNRLVLLLCAALGINSTSEMSQENIDLINGLLQEAWKFLTQHVLEMTDTEYQGYKLDLMDKDKVCLQIIDTAYICPVDNVPIDTIFRGYSPRMDGYISKANFERYKIKDSKLIYPYFPYPMRNKNIEGVYTKVSDEEIYGWINEKWEEIRKRGALNSLIVNIFMLRPIFIAGEHSGQQQRQILDKYEDEFNKGHLNILSCSTTMEMGVDLSGISEVVMNDVPPKPANYLQRAGRAGRRGETKALALTFCAPNPIGMSAWNHPGWSISHITEMPIVKLDSSQIVQRQVNSLIFAKYVTSLGGIRIKSTIEDFFDGEISICDKFCDTIDNVINDKGNTDWNKDYSRLVYDTVMSHVSFKDAAYLCKKSILLTKEIYKQRISALDKIIEDTENNRQLNAVINRKKIFAHTALITWLAENNFLPSAGIPTGLVEFIPDLSHVNKERTKMPTMHLSQAISAYAPGNKIVINEWCYRSAGIIMKTQFDDTKKNVIQYCTHCHYTTIVYGKPYNECPVCHRAGTMQGLKDMSIGTNKFTEIIEPAGFSVDWSSKPTRVLKSISSMNLVQPILLEMEPWIEEDNSAIRFKMRRSTTKSEILFYNKGYGYGYALCPYCGRMEAEYNFAGIINDKQPLNLHRHLIAGKECQGNDNYGINIRRNVLLVGRYQTDFVEIKFYDNDHYEIKDPSTLYSIGTILSRKLTEILGINEGEIDFGYNVSYDSIFIYDTALGGSGYSPLLFDYKELVFQEAYKALKNCDCEKACTNCLIDKNTQWYVNYLDRHKALKWLESEVESHNVSVDIKSIYNDAIQITTDLYTELYHVLRGNNIEHIKIFTTNDISKWNPDAFPYLHRMKELALNGTSFSLCINKEINLTNLPADNLSNTLPILLRTNILYFNRNDCISPLLSITFKDGHKRTYFCKKFYFEYNQDWGKGQPIYVTSIFEEISNISPISKLDIINSIKSTDHIVFESNMDSDTNTEYFFDSLCKKDRKNWKDIFDLIPKGEDVYLTYSDRYLKTPLGCILLGHLIKQLKNKILFNSKKMTALLPIGGIPAYKDNSKKDILLTDDFPTYKECDRFLTKCLIEIAGINIDIIHERIPHYRSLSISGNSFELSIRPDGGVAYGWALDNRVNPYLTLDDIENDLSQDIELHNKVIKTGGILYTIAFKKKTKPAYTI